MYVVEIYQERGYWKKPSKLKATSLQSQSLAKKRVLGFCKTYDLWISLVILTFVLTWSAVSLWFNPVVVVYLIYLRDVICVVLRGKNGEAVISKTHILIDYLLRTIFTWTRGQCARWVRKFTRNMFISLLWSMRCRSVVWSKFLSFRFKHMPRDVNL